MNRIKADYILDSYNFGVFALLVLLYFAYSYLQIPEWVIPIGRAHIVFLHLPIGLWFACLLIIFVRQQPNSNAALIWKIMTSMALTSAVMGLILSSETGYDREAIAWHRHLGFGFAVFCYFIGFIEDKSPGFRNNFLYFIGSILLVAAGHLGAEITHGKHFLFPKFPDQSDTKQYNEQSNIYETLVFPILSSKCVSCHNPSKKKGDLTMADTTSLISGGESGIIIDRINRANSLLLKRIHLPLEAEEHMPPEGKEQLSGEELEIIEMWIAGGASFSTKIGDLDEDHLFRNLTEKYNQEITKNKTYNFKLVSQEVLSSINSDFTTVQPVAVNSPALKASFFVASEFESSSLFQLSGVRDQLVYLNLSYMPLQEEDWTFISGFPHLEELILNYSSFSDADLDKIFSISSLKRLSLAGTQVTDDLGLHLINVKELEEIFLSDTQISPDSIEQWSKRYPNIYFNYESISDEILQLTPPILINAKSIYNKGDKLELESKIRGTIIKYTTDGSSPEGLESDFYNQPILIDENLTLKTIATKEGWHNSEEVKYSIFVKGVSADTAILHNLPSPKYPGKGAGTLTDEIKGEIDALQDGAWLGFMENPMEIDFHFNKPQQIKSCVLSYGIHVPAYVFPPTTITIYAGTSVDDLKLIERRTLAGIEENQKSLREISYIDIPLAIDSASLIRVHAENLRKIPNWHAGKGTPGWLFVDEILFN